MTDVPRSDVSRPSALPMGHLQRQNRGPASAQVQALVEQSSSDYLDDIEEEWNAKVDVEVANLVDGMLDLVTLATIQDKDKFRVAQEGFQIQSRAESMVRGAHTLLSITHSMKLLLLLSDEAQIAHRRDAEMQIVQEEKEKTKKEVENLLNQLLRPNK